MIECHFRHTHFQPDVPRPVHPGCPGDGRLYRWSPAGPNWEPPCPEWHLLDDIRCTACDFRAPGSVAVQMLAPPSTSKRMKSDREEWVSALRETLG